MRRETKTIDCVVEEGFNQLVSCSFSTINTSISSLMHFSPFTTRCGRSFRKNRPNPKKSKNFCCLVCAFPNRTIYAASRPRTLPVPEATPRVEAGAEAEVEANPVTKTISKRKAPTRPHARVIHPPTGPRPCHTLRPTSIPLLRRLGAASAEAAEAPVSAAPRGGPAAEPHPLPVHVCCRRRLRAGSRFDADLGTRFCVLRGRIPTPVVPQLRRPRIMLTGENLQSPSPGETQSHRKVRDVVNFKKILFFKGGCNIVIKHLKSIRVQKPFFHLF